MLEVSEPSLPLYETGTIRELLHVILSTPMTDHEREHVLAQILSIETYAALQHEVPYTYQLAYPEATLTVIGVNHVFSLEHPAFTLIDNVLATVSCDVVCVEGMDAEFQEPLARQLLATLTASDAHARGGEAVYAVVRARERSIPFEPVEPPDDALYSYLLTLGFSRADIIAWYVLRLLPQYIAQGELAPLPVYLEPFLQDFARATKWDDSLFVVETITGHIATTLKRDVSFRSYDRAYALTDPLIVADRDNDFSVFNTLSVVADVFRDRTMVTRVASHVERGESVVFIVGVAHAVMQEPAYRSLVDVLK